MEGGDTSPYVLLERVGAGGVGEVHLARDPRLDRNVALKLLRTEAATDEGARRRFVLEARAAAAIDHPFVCKVYEAGVLGDGRAFIAMEYIDGVTLDRWLGGAPPHGDRVRVAMEVAEALDEAHGKGFIHRDLKPANLMVTRGGHAKVLDFGIAKQIHDGRPGLTQEGRVWGTFEYFSPEQASGDPIDHRSDLFSFGIVLYEMFAGVHPFRRDSPMKTAVAIMAQSPPPLRAHTEDSGALEPVIRRLLEKDPDDRFETAADLRSALSSMNGGEHGRAGATVHDSVAVLPFRRISASEDDEYFVDGITEEIITRLSRLSSLKVISRTSVMRYKAADEDLATIGRRLGVTTLVEGSLRRAGDRVRITARLVAVPGDRQLWGESYDRNLQDVFAVQEEVAEEISAALSRSLAHRDASGRGTDQVASLETYSEYLKGRYSMNKLTPEGIQTGIRHFAKALEMNAAYGDAHAGLALCHAYSGHLGFVPFAVAFPASRAAAVRALQIDPSLPEAEAALALVALLHDWDWEAADRHFERALELNPNFSAAHLSYSWYFLAVGKNDRAIAEAARAVELDPLSAMNYMALGWVQFYSGLYTESLVQYRKALELEPDHQVSRDQIGGTFIAMGRHDEAIEILREAVNPI
ncbi:MAG TPA: protein kinase, partial [Longimicrobiales bacterium]|nr:protein kinase [Longimicrobiales bacterium]